MLQTNPLQRESPLRSHLRRANLLVPRQRPQPFTSNNDAPTPKPTPRKNEDFNDKLIPWILPITETFVSYQVDYFAPGVCQISLDLSPDWEPSKGVEDKAYRLPQKMQMDQNLHTYFSISSDESDHAYLRYIIPQPVYDYNPGMVKKHHNFRQHYIYGMEVSRCMLIMPELIDDPEFVTKWNDWRKKMAGLFHLFSLEEQQYLLQVLTDDKFVVVNKKLPEMLGEPGQSQEVILAVQQKYDLLLKQFGIDFTRTQQRQKDLVADMPVNIEMERKYDMEMEIDQFEMKSKSRNEVSHSQSKPKRQNNLNNNNSNENREAESNEVDLVQQDRLFDELLQQREQLDQKISQMQRKRKQQCKDNIGNMGKMQQNNVLDQQQTMASMGSYKNRMDNLLGRNQTTHDAAKRLQQNIQHRNMANQSNKKYGIQSNYQPPANISASGFNRNSPGHQAYLRAKKEAGKRLEKEKLHWEQMRQRRNWNPNLNKKRGVSTTINVKHQNRVESSNNNNNENVNTAATKVKEEIKAENFIHPPLIRHKQPQFPAITDLKRNQSDAVLASNLADVINNDNDLKQQQQGLVLQRSQPIATPIRAGAVPALRSNTAVLQTISQEHRNQLNRILGQYGQSINSSLLQAANVQVEGQVEDTGAQQQLQQQKQSVVNNFGVEGQVLDTSLQQQQVGNNLSGNGINNDQNKSS